MKPMHGAFSDTDTDLLLVLARHISGNSGRASVMETDRALTVALHGARG